LIRQHGHPSESPVQQAESPAQQTKGPDKSRAPVPTDAEGGTQQIKVVGMRRQIAQKMQESKRQIPHFSYVEEVDVTELEALRKQLNDRADTDDPRLTLLPFLVKAMVLAVRKHPEMNATFDDQDNVITRFDDVNLGIAAQTDRGLMVPVI